ncbi:MAG: sensor histidine kinase [Thermincola sp.]|jgi:two-component system sensor histidine kinase DegS|nr:sensor histidine kinase [Thermincola sp.]MDT3703230.1 sensor histidine kinase [Thermincola sp.]
MRSESEGGSLTKELQNKIIEYQEEIERYKINENRLLAQVIAAQENERRKLGMELHDNVLQSLASLKMHLQALNSLINGASPEAKNCLLNVEDVLREVIQDCRVISFNRDSFWLEKAGLIPALNSYFRKLANRNGIVIDFKYNQSINLNNRLIEAHIFRIIQEALNNIQKHAQCRRVEVKIDSFETCIDLVIKDDGQGFDPQPFLDNNEDIGRVHSHFGLISIISRVKLLKGEIKIHSALKEGTLLLIQIPLRVDNRQQKRGERKSPWVHRK